NTQSFLTDIDAGLTSENHSCFKTLVFATHIVHIQSKKMRGAMWEILFVGRPVRILFVDVIFGDESQSNQFALHHFANFCMVLIPDISYDKHAFSCLENP